MEQINFVADERIMSDTINELAAALCKAQAEFNIASKDKNNPFFKSKYADFESVVAASRPALTKYGLSVVQNVYRCNDGNHYLITLLLHSSGQWLKSKAQHNPQKNDVQALSSYNTYLKRMCYSSLLGVVTGEYDDDGEASIARKQEIDYKNQYTIGPSEQNYLQSLPEDTQTKIKEFYKVDSFAYLTESQYSAILTRMKNKSA